MSLNRKKLEEAIVFVGSHPAVSELGMTKLYKLLYFADVHHLREHGSTITGSEYIKYEHGPIPSRGERAVKALNKAQRVRVEILPRDSFKLHHVEALSDPDASEFSQEELEALDRTCKVLGAATANALSELSHEEPAWLNARRLQKLSPALMHYGSSEDPDGL